jgi:hypothetical protein
MSIPYVPQQFRSPAFLKKPGFLALTTAGRPARNLRTLVAPYVNHPG